MMKSVTLEQALDYEVKSSRFIGFVSCDFIQALISSHMARKVLAKHMRYLEHIELTNRVDARNASR